MKAWPLLLCCAAAVQAGDADAWRSRGFRPWRVGADSLETWRQPHRPQLLANQGTLCKLAPKQWPELMRRPIPWASIQRCPRTKKRDWDRSRSLGQVALGSAAPTATLLAEHDATHAKVQSTDTAGKTLSVWVSRASPAIVCHTDASALRFFVGKDALQPRFCAYEANGRAHVAAAAGAVDIPIFAKPWLLVWFGHAFGSSRFSGYMPYEYPADCPVLFVFRDTPKGVSFQDGMTVDFGPEAVGHVAMLPPYGDSYPLAGMDDGWLKTPHAVEWRRYPAEFRQYCYPPDFRTDTWAKGLPDDVLGVCRWWAGHLREVAVSARESYAYDEASDTLTVTERFGFIRLAEGGTRLAPVPPMLALAVEQGFPIAFDGKPTKTSVLTAHGPFMGFEGVQRYEWQLRGLQRYVFDRRPAEGKGEVPRALLAELEAEVAKILDAGELAPWYPVLDDNGAGYLGYYDRGHRGHFVFGNPGETLYYLGEVAPFLRPATRDKIVAYLRVSRANHPPETPLFVPAGQGAPRERYRPTPATINARLNKHFRESNFHWRLGLVPEQNFYHLADYYEVTGDMGELRARWRDVLAEIEPHLANRDWATMGTVRRPVAWHGRAGLGGVMDINNLFAGLGGAIRLARMAGDKQAEQRLWGEFGRVAALRFALGKYYRYLYGHGLLRAPEGKDWMMRLLRGSWCGYLYTTHWRGIEDEIQQVWQMDQFGVYFRECRVGDGFSAWPGQVAFLDPVPELGRFFRDHLRAEAEALVRRADEAMPAWYAPYCPAVQTAEANFQPPEDAHQLFLLHAWVLDTPPERLAWLRSVPWLARGDLFYLQKLTETIRAYRDRSKE